ncbi:hypothetical protein [Hymenobacter rubidus]|uniref:hypothetical protein n=1 Tax=Hymenobacter rubidus TaxID=1441626 RepID=UPI0019200A79|nr:hypothetical protein [Hymenobacter rubidus]
MKENKASIVTNYFILGEGSDGIYSDITIEISPSTTATLKRGDKIEIKDERLLERIESEFQNKWIKPYSKSGIFLSIRILNIGIDKSGRKYAVENSVGGLMHDALPKIGIKPPQIFRL